MGSIKSAAHCSLTTPPSLHAALQKPFLRAQPGMSVETSLSSVEGILTMWQSHAGVPVTVPPAD